MAKTHSDYWKARLEHRCYTLQGKLVEVNEWSIRIQHLGKRKGFALGTNNKDAAAIKARDIYLNVVAKGWDATEKQFNPEMIVRKDAPTVGALVARLVSGDRGVCESLGAVGPRGISRASAGVVAGAHAWRIGHAGWADAHVARAADDGEHAGWSRLREGPHVTLVALRSTQRMVRALFSRAT